MFYDEKTIREYVNLLGLPDKFDYKILKKFYKNSVLKYHPDRVQSTDDKFLYEKMMKEINNANETLKKLLDANNGHYLLKSEETEKPVQKIVRPNSQYTYKNYDVGKDKFYFNIGYAGIIFYILFMFLSTLGREYFIYEIICWLLAIILFPIGLVSSILRRF